MKSSVLNLSWSFGFNPTTRMFNLSDKQKILFYASGHTGVLFDYQSTKQKMLQGHVNEITAAFVSKDKVYIGTADKGNESALIIWKVQGLNATPIKTIFSPHGTGILSAEFSSDSKYLFTLGNDSPQTLAVWDWSSPSTTPIATFTTLYHQESIKVHPNGIEFMTTGPTNVLFYTIDKEFQIQCFEPILSLNDFKKLPTGYTTSTFTEEGAISATLEGEVVVWMNYTLGNLTTKLKTGQKGAIKFIKLHNSAINYVDWLDQYIVTGGEEGHVKVYDLSFRLLFWEEKLNAGPISSISITSEKLFSGYDIPELLVGTKHSKIILLHDNQMPQEKVLTAAKSELLYGQYGRITGLKAHPSKNHFAVSNEAGLLQIWDFSSKQLVKSRLFQIVRTEKTMDSVKTHITPLHIECIAYHPTGDFIGLGLKNGVVRFVDSDTLEDVPQVQLLPNGEPGHQVSKHPILKIAFSQSYCAVSDVKYFVSCFVLKSVTIQKDTDFTKTSIQDLTETRNEWLVLGKTKTHYNDIISLLFSPSQVLYSVSRDRHVSEYDLENSNVTQGLVVKSIRRIEQYYYPEASAFMTRTDHVHPEEFIMTFNSGNKFKKYTASSQLTRQTTLGPNFGIIKHISLFPENDPQYMVFGTNQQIVGVCKFPLDGNPFKSAGVVAHPGAISGLATSSDGTQVLSVSESGNVVFLWTMNTGALEAQIQLGGEGIEPFLNMLDPSGALEESPIYKEFEDYFYYGQLKSQGEDLSTDRIVSDKVPLDQVPGIMQAMGYYPSSVEMDDLINEVKYSRFAQGEGEQVTHITFHDLIKLYLNHKPFRDITRKDIVDALAQASHIEPGRTQRETVTLETPIKMSGLVALLQQYGESMSEADIKQAFSLLDKSIPVKFTPQEFIQDILQFE